ncbi:hypothetical protein GCM10009779_03410 [Polymorphospora rubra]|uniref:Integrase n=1 Tax=Polymorphospora rubra TaxID=338584 RepID=A0A810MWS4_9ACTN|nr:hypothetical protein Prubr_26380 [Polymorphospora rubra]
MLARVPYHLRHAAVSLWLNAGVPATQVAEWAGNSVHVLLKVYSSCIEGQDEAARKRIEGALGTPDPDETPEGRPVTQAAGREASWRLANFAADLPRPVGRSRSTQDVARLARYL